MSASGDGTRSPPKSKGKTLSSFFGSLPGFSSARNLVSHTHSSTKDTGPATDPTGTPALPPLGATNLHPIPRGASGLLQPSEQTTAGCKDVGSFSVTSGEDAFSSGVAGIIDTAKGMVQGGLGATQSALVGTKEAVSGGIMGAVEPSCSEISSLANTCGLGLITEPIATTKGLVSGVASSAHAVPRSEEECGQLAATSFAALHDELEGLGDIFQPMTAEEQAQLAASETGPRVLSADRRSYFVRLGDLAPSFRQRAFEHALSHIQHNQFQARASLAQLQEAFQVTDMAVEAPGGHLRWDQGLSSTVEAAGTQKVRVSMAQDRLCTLACQLHAAYSSLTACLQGLPELQQQAGLARHSLCKLYGLVSSASGVDLQAEQLAQSSAGVVQAWQGLEVLLDRLQQSPPLAWLVGPFTVMPSGQL